MKHICDIRPWWVDQIFSFTKMYLKMPSTKWRTFNPGLSVLITHYPPILWNRTMAATTQGNCVLKIKMLTEGWVVYPRTSGSPEPTWPEALHALGQVGSGDPRGLGYTTQSSANILIFYYSPCFTINLQHLRCVSHPKHNRDRTHPHSQPQYAKIATGHIEKISTVPRDQPVKGPVTQ